MESKILELFYSNRYTKKQITDEIAKNMENFKVRQDLIHILDELSSEITTNEMIPIIQEMLKYEDTKNALLNDWQILVSDFSNGIGLAEVLAEDEDIKEDMKEHIEVLRDDVDWNKYLAIDKLIDIILKLDASGHGLKKLATKRILSSSAFGKEYINSLMERHETREFLGQNFQLVIQNCTNENGLKNIFYMTSQSKNFPELEDIYDKNKFLMDLYNQSIAKMESEISSVFGRNAFTSIAQTIIGTVIKNGKQEEIELELQDLSKGEPIKPLSIGGYSMVFETNEKVFKLGAEKVQFLIEKYHRRFMYPYLRKSYDDNLYIEAYEKGYADPNITNEELLMVYEELYRDGFIWLDAKKENLVRLKKDNALPEYVRQRDDTYSGFKRNLEEPITLKKGELAICDLDFIFHKDNPEFMHKNYKDFSVRIVKKLRRKLEAEEREAKNKNDDLEK